MARESLFRVGTEAELSSLSTGGGAITIPRQRRIPRALPVLRESALLHAPTTRDVVAARRHEIAKRLFDAGTALVLLVLLWPGMVAIAIAIKLSSQGPILFRQRRYGRDGETFEILKFRTMFATQSDLSGVRQTKRDDPRVTPIGRFLRRSSLDELPQLFNVLRGDMSLVGPRPHVPGMLAGGVLYENLVPCYFERHRVRPGITGLAQVNGLRGSTEDPEIAAARIDQDLLYIEHQSLLLDLRLIWATIRNELLSGSGV